ncbi:helix-turn-helix transcriptional regulator [Streptomyces sp. NPDC001581]|uniref:helix-turn-helix transcriptional regulator n=1 Tax=Streptomyces sp. NPDC001581 TaxID=3154386 RepID=UPI003316E128
MASERIFDTRRFRVARLVSGLTQGQLGAAVGVNDRTVSRWEKELTTPPPEKLAKLASALGQSIDELFPRQSLPTLAGLRCDAGLTQQDTAAIIGTRSEISVRRAEGGKRRLAVEYVPPLAKAYGVTPARLLAAQERSFGNDVPEPKPAVRQDRPTLPAAEATSGIANRIAFLLAGEETTDSALAAQGNTRAGRQVLTPEVVSALRSGVQTSASDEVLEVLALALDAPPLFLSSDDEEVHRIVSVARLLRRGVTGMAARGDGDPLTAQVLDFINETVEAIQSDLPGARARERRQSKGHHRTTSTN